MRWVVPLCAQPRKQSSEPCETLHLIRTPNTGWWAWPIVDPFRPSHHSGSLSFAPMFSANLTWTPVVEVGPKGNDKVVSPDSPSEPEGDRVEASSPIGDGVSVRSSNSRKLSVFRWNKVKRSGTSSSSDHGRHGSSSGGSGRPKNAESVAEMPEDTGIVRHELPAAGASQSSPPARPQRLASGSSPSTSFPSRVLPVANGRFDLPTQSPSRYHSPTSIHGSESGVLQPPERQYRMRNLKTPDNEVRSNSESWGGNWYETLRTTSI